MWPHVALTLRALRFNLLLRHDGTERMPVVRRSAKQSRQPSEEAALASPSGFEAAAEAAGWDCGPAAGGCFSFGLQNLSTMACNFARTSGVS